MRNGFSRMMVGSLVIAGVVAIAACSTSNRDTNEAAGEVIARVAPIGGFANPLVFRPAPR